jgi:DNA-binding CsgD family transcriptional regulator
VLTSDVREPSVHIDVESRVLEHALLHVVEAAGWRTTRHRHDVAVVSDRLSSGDDVDILVVEPTPLGCRTGMDAVVGRQVRAVMCADEPDSLTDALDALDDVWCLIPARVLEQAATLPELSARQRQIAGAIAAGQTNLLIARGLRVSEATVKREVATLLRTLDATDRLSLVSRLAPLGLLPQRVHG